MISALIKSKHVAKKKIEPLKCFLLLTNRLTDLIKPRACRSMDEWNRTAVSNVGVTKQLQQVDVAVFVAAIPPSTT